MRPASLWLLALGMLACSGRTDNPGEETSGGSAGAGATSGKGGNGGKGGSAGKGGAGGSAGSGARGGAGGTDGGAGGEGGEVAVDTSYCRELTESLTTGSGAPAVALVPLSTTDVAGSTCGAVERAFPLEAATHVTACGELEYGTNPPSSGTHYGVWPSFKAYDEPVPRGFLVHGMEHGAVVIGYACDDCEDEVEAARELVAGIGPDPLCCSDPSCTGATTRVVLAPDPRLDTVWAAASWGFTLTSDCFEPEVFRAFVEEHRGRGPEAVCSNGVDVANY